MSKSVSSVDSLAGSLIVLGLFLVGLGGGFIPWIWRDAVALQLTAPGLAEYIKFLAEVRNGIIQVERLYFLYPLFGAMLLLPLFAENRQLNLPRWLRWSLRLAVFPLALTSLSPVWAPDVLLTSEFRLQTMLAITAIGLTVIAPLLRQIPLLILVGVLFVVMPISLYLSMQTFWLVHTPLEYTYHEAIVLGAGWWVSLTGGIMSMIGGGWAMVSRYLGR
ncbi:hypothetical protein QUF58_04210 [Anaerolineales bacterium HSG24]|nr:hypothetical protein [Anaerolineales bacterium HSG24]